MEIDVITASENLKGEKIRYINYNNQNYLIFSLKEVDIEGYEKLYINKIVNENEELIDDIEWEEIKKMIPVIVKEIKTNEIISFNDLEINKIKSVNLDYSRPFKIKASIVDEIKKEEIIPNNMEENIEEDKEDNEENIEEDKEDNEEYLEALDIDDFLNNYDEEIRKNEEELNKVEVPIRPDFDNNIINTEKNDINEELEREKNKIIELQKEIEELKAENSNYKDKLERIKIMLEA